MLSKFWYGSTSDDFEVIAKKPMQFQTFRLQNEDQSLTINLIVKDIDDLAENWLHNLFLQRARLCENMFLGPVCSRIIYRRRGSWTYATPDDKDSFQ